MAVRALANSDDLKMNDREGFSMSDSASVDRLVIRLRAHSETSKFVYCPMCGSLTQLIRGGGGETLVEPNRSCNGAVVSLSRDAIIDRLMCDDFDA